jgi:hypothetical protein
MKVAFIAWAEATIIRLQVLLQPNLPAPAGPPADNGLVKMFLFFKRALAQLLAVHTILFIHNSMQSTFSFLWGAAWCQFVTFSLHS